MAERPMRYGNHDSPPRSSRMLKSTPFRSLIGALAALSILADRSPAGATVVTAPATSDCVWCHEDCPVGQHTAGNSGMSLPSEWTRNGGAHTGGDCFSGTCDTKHGPTPCDEGGGTVIPEGASDALLASLSDRDVDAFKRIGASFPNSIIVNADRAAVQIIGCRGAVVAHLPVDPTFIRELMD